MVVTQDLQQLPQLLLLIHHRPLLPPFVHDLHLRLHNLAQLPHVFYVVVNLHPPPPQFHTRIPLSHFHRSQLNVEMIWKLEMLTYEGHPLIPKRKAHHKVFSKDFQQRLEAEMSRFRVLG